MSNKQVEQKYWDSVVYDYRVDPYGNITERDGHTYQVIDTGNRLELIKDGIMLHYCEI